ncbi:hypothetical protein HGRIS_004214 [Hohenbuehelia grisea]|uniref:Calpain catalytic domain-containing protein n=1 Tax=Hohenbuehelia grisea TaxID=104357 RepID=A0ABR3JI82_9AGAR
MLSLTSKTIDKCIFDNPKLFGDGAKAADIVQGALGNCWFLSALSVVATSKGLMDKLCVAHDAEVGVYGFIFFRDTTWVTVIVDDQLFMSIPKYEDLALPEKRLYHGDKTRFNEHARKGGAALKFANSGKNGGTWVSH